VFGEDIQVNVHKIIIRKYGKMGAKFASQQFLHHDCCNVKSVIYLFILRSNATTKNF
jgi:hypothetical protein